MGKLHDRLQKQLLTENKKDAEDCLKIYEHLKKTTGSVWQSDWQTLTTVSFDKPFSAVRTYRLSSTGRTYLAGILAQEQIYY